MPFLKLARQVPPGREWAKEIVSRTGGTIAFRATSQGPIAVTVVTERGYKALLAGAAFDKTDSLFSADSPAGALDGRVRLPAGSSWFILENQAEHPVEMHLECFAAD